jgi:ABC-type glutathione transport system ATPase component
MLAMKLMALRIDPGSGRNDREDILNLMQVTGMKEKADIVQFAARFLSGGPHQRRARACG